MEATQHQRLLIGVAALVLIAAGVFLFWAKQRVVPAVPFPYHIVGNWESKSSDGKDDVDFSLRSEYPSEDADGRMLGESVTSGPESTGADSSETYTCSNQEAVWHATGNSLILWCGDKILRSFMIQKGGLDIVLVDTGNTRVFTRQKALQFQYQEGGRDKRLTLYEIPGVPCHACSGYLWGVFEQRHQWGTFNVATVTAPFSAVGSYGRISTVNVLAKDLTEWNATSSSLLTPIGKNKLAILFPTGDMHMGYEWSGGWLLEYSNNALIYRGFFRLHADNSGTCNVSLKHKNKETSEEPCASSDATLSIVSSSITPHSEYYDITVQRSGTEYNYYTDKVTPVVASELYYVDPASGEYTSTNVDLGEGFVYGYLDTYVRTKATLVANGWRVYVPDDYKSSPTVDAKFPEIKDCGTGVDAVCGVYFIKGDVPRNLNIQIGGREQYADWVVVGSE